MARRIRISTVGCSPAGAGASGGDVAEQLVRDLGAQMAQVTPQRPDLIVLPEMCDVPGVVMSGPGAEEKLRDHIRRVHEPVMRLMSRTAASHGCYLVYPTAAIDDQGRLRNTAFVLDRAGRMIGRYDKHRPTVGELAMGIVPGDGAAVIDCDFGRLGLAICFDLNFTELLDEYRRLRPDVLVFASMFHGGLMQSYWAYACRAHLVSAIEKTGLPSEVHRPTGDLAATTTNYFNHVTATINLDCAVVHLDCLFSKLDALRQEYGQRLCIHDPGRLGSVLLSAEADDLTIDQVIERFDLELLDDYLNRSRQRAAAVR